MELSKWAQRVKGYVPRMAFEGCINGMRPTNSDLDSFVRMYIIENIPKFISRCPIAYDKIRNLIADSLGVAYHEIYLTGSAKLGFSLNPKKWLHPFQPFESDLDFFIISEKLFLELSQDVEAWKSDESDDPEVVKKISWVEKNINRGFVDDWHIPLRYPVVKRCRYVMLRVCVEINRMLRREVLNPQKKGASIRCYRDYNSAIRQIKINISDAISKASPKS